MEKLKNQIVDICRRLERRGFVANHDGNISVRLETDRFLVTPTAFAKNDVTPGDLLICDLEGKVIEGPHRIFSEWKWHRAIYEANAQVTSVVHAHPPTSMGFGLTGKQLGFGSIPEAIVSLGGPLRTLCGIDYFADQKDIITSLGSSLTECYAVLVQGNGVFALGNCALDAYLRLELVEQVLRAHAAAAQVGVIENLDSTQVKKLLERRPALKAGWKDSSGIVSPQGETKPPAKSEMDPANLEKLIREVIASSF